MRRATGFGPLLLPALLITAVATAGCPGTPIVDAGTSDAGDGDGDGDDDAGVLDAGGGDTCAPATDPDLGSLGLGSGYTKVDAATLDTSDLLALLEDPDVGTGFYALGGGGNVRYLDGWPTLTDDGLVDWSIIRPEDAEDLVFASAFLTTAGGHIVGGYTKSSEGAEIPGTITRLDPAAPNAPTFYDAPGVFSAATLGDQLLVNGLGLGAESSGPAVYALDLDDDTVATVVTFGDSAFSGYTVAGDDFAVAGSFGSDFTNDLTVVSAAAVTSAITGAPVDVATLPAFGPPDLLNAGALDDRVIVLDGFYDENFSAVQTAVTAYPIADGTPGAGEQVLSWLETSCEQVVLFSRVGDDLLVALNHADGSGHLVRLARN
jgi:hypothetical protein